MNDVMLRSFRKPRPDQYSQLLLLKEKWLLSSTMVWWAKSPNHPLVLFEHSKRSINVRHTVLVFRMLKFNTEGCHIKGPNSYLWIIALKCLYCIIHSFQTSKVLDNFIKGDSQCPQSFNSQKSFSLSQCNKSIWGLTYSVEPYWLHNLVVNLLI